MTAANPDLNLSRNFSQFTSQVLLPLDPLPEERPRAVIEIEFLQKPLEPLVVPLPQVPQQHPPVVHHRLEDVSQLPVQSLLPPRRVPVRVQQRVLVLVVADLGGDSIMGSTSGWSPHHQVGGEVKLSENGNFT